MILVHSYPHIETALRKLPKPVVEAMKVHPYRAVVAGGFLRAISCGNNPISDIDIFMLGKDKAEKVKNILDFLAIIHKERWAQKDSRWVLTKNAVTTRVEEQDVQLILGFDAESPNKLLDQFDLTISKAAVWLQGVDSGGRQKMDGLCTHSFLRDVCQRRIVFEPTTEQKAAVPAMNSIPRICKFLRQGFTIDAPSLTSFVVHAANCLASAPGMFTSMQLIKDGSKEDGDSRDIDVVPAPGPADKSSNPSDAPVNPEPKVFRSLSELEPELWTYAARH